MRTKKEFEEWFTTNKPPSDDLTEVAWSGYQLASYDYEMDRYKEWNQLKLFDDGSTR